MGKVYYTLYGTDPRLPESVSGGELVSPGAIEYNDKMDINYTTVIKSRTLYNGKWSALNEIILTIPQGFDNLKITEIHYHPLDLDGINDGEFEFVELKNMGDESLNLGELNFCRGIDYTFPGETEIIHGEYIILASNSLEFEKRYGFKPFDEYTGQLANNGETITLQNADSVSLISIKYDDKYPWPNSADGDGYSIILAEEHAYKDLNNANNWRASENINGSPGKSDVVAVSDVSENLLTQFYLFQNYPNPFNPSTKIEFFLLKPEYVTIEIYNTLGQRIVSLINKKMPVGRHQIEFDGKNLSSGVYIYRIEAGGFFQVKKMVLIK